MLDLYNIVFNSQSGEAIGCHPFYVEENENKDEVVYRAIKECRKLYNSKNEQLFFYNKNSEKMNEVTDKFSRLLKGNEKDNQISNWIWETRDKLITTGYVEIDNGDFQEIFLNHLEKQNVEHTVDKGVNSCTFRYDVEKDRSILTQYDFQIEEG